MFGNLFRSLTLLAASVLVSCASTSYPYHFEPTPAEVQIEAAPGGPLLARVFVGVMGAERVGKVASGHPDLLVRVRVESKGLGPMRFDPATAKVLGPDLASFGSARVDGAIAPGEPSGVIEVPLGEARDVTLRFAFPRDGDLRMPRLTGVNVSLTIDTPAGAKELSVALARNQYDLFDATYSYPYYYYGGHAHWHAGFIYGDC